MSPRISTENGKNFGRGYAIELQRNSKRVIFQLVDRISLQWINISAYALLRSGRKLSLPMVFLF